MSTIREIAKKACVSSSTVSRVLNNDLTLSVAQETRDRIYKVANELNYTTIKHRKIMKRSSGDSGKTIGVLTWCSYERELQDPYFLAIRQGVENECIKRGITINSLIRIGNEPPVNVESSENLIVIGKISSELIKEAEHAVVVNYSPNVQKYDSVVIDYETATLSALEHLASLGHEDIGFIGGKEYQEDTKVEIVEERLSTFEKFMAQRGLSKNFHRNIYTGEFSMSEGYRLMKEALESRHLPTAFFVASDSMAVGVLRALHEKGLRVPGDMSIVSFNDIQISEFTNPTLTTVKVFTKEMGEMAVKLLLDQLEGRKIPLKVVLPTQLIVRESSGMNIKNIKRLRD